MFYVGTLNTVVAERGQKMDSSGCDSGGGACSTICDTGVGDGGFSSGAGCDFVSGGVSSESNQDFSNGGYQTADGMHSVNGGTFHGHDSLSSPLHGIIDTHFVHHKDKFGPGHAEMIQTSTFRPYYIKSGNVAFIRQPVYRSEGVSRFRKVCSAISIIGIGIMAITFIVVVVLVVSQF